VRRVDDNADEMIGQDSFLDVVTNIVGILILLVMVAGLRSSKAAVTAVEEQSAAVQRLPSGEDAVRKAYQTAAEQEHDVRDVFRRAVDSRQDTMLREHERLWLTSAVAEAEQEIAARRAKLSANNQRDFDLRRQLSDAQLKLDALTREQVALVGQEEIEEIRCEPTTIGRQVTGKEVHVYLADDHIAIILADDLIKLMYDDIAQNTWRLKQEPELTRTIGPIGGFRLKYNFLTKNFVGSGPRGSVVSGKAAEFRGFFLLPETTPIGEPATEAMASGSELTRFLDERDPGRTTLTIWVYPGNYDRLRELKKWARELGYQTAVRPLPAGMPVGFSPSGTSSMSD
jgi:hypothetical protein